MKKWQIENSETSEISEILFRVFLFPSFRFFPIAKIKNSDLKISEKIRSFPIFPSFRSGHWKSNLRGIASYYEKVIRIDEYLFSCQSLADSR